jgi:ABC-2 type transport system permease protein
VTAQAIPGLAAVRRPGAVLLAAARMQVLVVRSHPAIPLAAVVQPLVFYVIATSGAGADSPAKLAPVLVAVLLTSLWGATVWTAGGILRREVADGTLGRNLTSVTDARLVIIGKCLGSTLLVLGLLTGTGAALAVFSGLTIRLGSLPWLLAAFLLVTVSGTAMGFAMCGIFALTRHATHVTAALTYPLFILSGLMIPASLLPASLAWLSRLISLYWADRFIDAVINGDRLPWAALLGVAVLTTAYLLAGNLIFGRIVHRASVKGTIDLG